MNFSKLHVFNDNIPKEPYTGCVDDFFTDDWIRLVRFQHGDGRLPQYTSQFHVNRYDAKGLKKLCVQMMRYIVQCFMGGICSHNRFSYESVLDGISNLKLRRDRYTNKPYRFYGKKYLLVAESQFEQAVAIHPASDDIRATGSDSNPNILPKDLEIIGFPDTCFGANIHMWFLIESPLRWETIGMVIPLDGSSIYMQGELLCVDYSAYITNFDGIFGAYPL